MQSDERANGNEIAAEVGRNFEVSLPETRTAGHRWVIKTAEPAGQLLEELAPPKLRRRGRRPSCLGGF
jgi:hypothetical protein